MTKRKGWTGESQKHSMAARRIKTNLKSGYVNYQTKLLNVNPTKDEDVLNEDIKGVSAYIKANYKLNTQQKLAVLQWIKDFDYKEYNKPLGQWKEENKVSFIEEGVEPRRITKFGVWNAIAGHREIHYKNYPKKYWK